MTRGYVSMAKNPLAVVGLAADGSKVARYWGNLDDRRSAAKDQGLLSVCPEFGTEVCLSCDLGLDRALEVCDCRCSKCQHEYRCPCSRCSWEERKNADAQDGTDKGNRGIGG